MAEFTSKTIWAWSFLFQKILNYKFNLFNSYNTVCYLFHVWVLEFVAFDELVGLFYVVEFTCKELMVVFPINCLMSAGPVLVSHLSFFMLIIFVFLFLHHIAIDLSILLIFSNNQLLSPLIFFVYWVLLLSLFTFFCLL